MYKIKKKDCVIREKKESKGEGREFKKGDWLDKESKNSSQDNKNRR